MVSRRGDVPNIQHPVQLLNDSRSELLSIIRPNNTREHGHPKKHLVQKSRGDHLGSPLPDGDEPTPTAEATNHSEHILGLGLFSLMPTGDRVELQNPKRPSEQLGPRPGRHARHTPISTTELALGTPRTDVRVHARPPEISFKAVHSPFSALMPTKRTIVVLEQNPLPIPQGFQTLARHLILPPMNPRHRTPELDLALNHIVNTTEQNTIDQLITPGTLDNRIDTLPREIAWIALAQLNESCPHVAILGLGQQRSIVDRQVTTNPLGCRQTTLLDLRRRQAHNERTPIDTCSSSKLPHNIELLGRLDCLPTKSPTDRARFPAIRSGKEEPSATLPKVLTQLRHRMAVLRQPLVTNRIR